MNVPQMLGVPSESESRTEMFSVRLSTSERAKVEALAKRYKVKPSVLARYYLLKVIALLEQSDITDNIEVRLDTKNVNGG
jgi:hypothetical protein